MPWKLPCALVASLWAAAPAAAEQAIVSDVVARLSGPATNAESACGKTSPDVSLGREIVNAGKDIVRRIGEGDRRSSAGAHCKDVCGTLPAEAAFSARASITPQDWKGELSAGLPETVRANRASIRGPLISRDGETKTVCYTFINLSREDERYVGVEFTY